jgi:hypothetical protein
MEKLILNFIWNLDDPKKGKTILRKKINLEESQRNYFPM